MNHMSEKWAMRYMIMAKQIAEWSKDSHPVGCIAVSPDQREFVVGYNGFPRSISDGEYTTTNRNSDSVQKLRFSVHAETNMIANARRDISGWTLHTTFFPCLSCAKTLVAAEIAAIFYPPYTEDEEAKYLFRLSKMIFKKAGIGLYLHEEKMYKTL